MTSPSPSTDIAALRAAIVLPDITLPDGRTVVAKRLPPFNEYFGFLDALGETPSEGRTALDIAKARLTTAHGLLAGMGFDEADIAQLTPEEVMALAVRFFSESSGRVVGAMVT